MASTKRANARLLEVVRTRCSAIGKCAEDIVGNVSKLEPATSGTGKNKPPTRGDQSCAVPLLLRKIKEQAEVILTTAKSLNDALAAPLERFICGFPLTNEEFYILLATGIIKDCESPTTHEAFMMLHYRDTDVMGYIDVKAPPRDSGEPGKQRRLRLRVGNEIAPEDIRVSKLTARQREFLQTECPEVFRRFRID
jgi:hypothetical protein